jgi:hypothetical protein
VTTAWTPPAVRRPTLSKRAGDVPVLLAVVMLRTVAQQPRACGVEGDVGDRCWSVLYRHKLPHECAPRCLHPECGLAP